MSYATNIGKAIALQTPDRGDFWLRQTASDLAAERKAAAKTKADTTTKLAEVYDIDLKGGYLPAWGKAAKQEYANFVNTVAELRASDPNVSYAQLLTAKNLAKARIEDIKAQNDAVVNYISNPDYLKDAKWVAAAQQSDDFNVIAQYNNRPFYNVDATTGYTFLNPVKMKTYNIEQLYGTPSEERYVKTIPRGIDRYAQYSMDFPKDTELTIAEQLLNDDAYRLNVLFDLSSTDPLSKQKPDETMEQYTLRMTPMIDQEIQRRNITSKPKPFMKEERLPEAGGGDGAGKKKNNADIQVGTYTARYVGGGSKKARHKTIEKPVKVTNSINLSSDGFFRTAEGFEKIPSTYGPKNKVISFNFRPNKVVVMNVNGVIKRYAVGPIIKSDTGEVSPLYKILDLKEPPADQQWMTTQDIFVPYDNVKSLIENENDMGNLMNVKLGDLGGEEPINEDEFQ